MAAAVALPAPSPRRAPATPPPLAARPRAPGGLLLLLALVAAPGGLAAPLATSPPTKKKDARGMGLQGREKREELLPQGA